MRTAILFLLMACICGAMGQINKVGPCPVKSPDLSFELDKYLGTWYKYSLYESILTDYKCVTTNYTVKPDKPDYLDIPITGISLDTNEETIFPYEGYQIGGSFFNLVTNNESHSIVPNYIVLDTDYDNYAVVFSCESILGGLRHLETIWVTSRQRTLTPAFEDIAYGVVDRNGFDSTALIRDKCDLN